MSPIDQGTEAYRDYLVRGFGQVIAEAGGATEFVLNERGLPAAHTEIEPNMVMYALAEQIAWVAVQTGQYSSTKDRRQLADAIRTQVLNSMRRLSVVGQQPMND